MHIVGMNDKIYCYLLTGHISSPRLQSHDQDWIIRDLCGEILATTSF